MPNSSAGFGFRAFGHRDGSAPTQGFSRYLVSTADTFPHFTGDLVVLSSAAPGAGYIGNWDNPATVQAAPIGVCAGFEYYSPQVGRVIWDKQIPAGAGAVSSQGAYAYVIDDPEMQFLVRCQASAWNPLLIGNTVKLSTQAGSLSSQGNTVTGFSVQTLNSSTIITTQTASQPFVVVDVYSNYAPPGVDGTDNSSNYNIVVVAPNYWARKAGTIIVST